MKETAASLGVMAAAGLAITIYLCWTTPATPTAVCLTHKEARQLWPNRHIFWYGSRHGADEGQKCWSNRRHGPPRGIRIDPVDPIFPPKAEHRRLELDNSKEVMPDAGLEAEHNKKEPRLASGAEEEDHCCWPALDADPNGNIVEVPEPFVRRWYEFPTVFVFYRQRYVNP